MTVELTGQVRSRNLSRKKCLEPPTHTWLLTHENGWMPKLNLHTQHTKGLITEPWITPTFVSEAVDKKNGREGWGIKWDYSLKSHKERHLQKKKKRSSKEQSYKSYSTYENFHNCSEIHGAKYVNITHWLAILSSQNPLCLVSITFYLTKTPFFPYCPKDYYKSFPTS